jgi:ribosomal-protein-alanine N-acetyltransferase
MLANKRLTLRTPRLIIRDYQTSNFAGVHEYSRDPETVKFMTWGPNSPEDTRKFIKLAISQQAINPRVNYHFVVLARGTMTVLGGCGIHIQPPNFHNAEIGYCFNKSYWGQGFATEAVGVLHQFGFKTLDLHRIIATCDVRNIASARVMEKDFMLREAHFIKHIWQRSEWRNSYLYAILEDEWQDKTIPR